jgi:hypothetical protein
MFQSALLYIALFFALCLFVFLGIALFNIFRKSYKPQKTLVVILPILALFMFTGFMAMWNFINLLGAIS